MFFGSESPKSEDWFHGFIFFLGGSSSGSYTANMFLISAPGCNECTKHE